MFREFDSDYYKPTRTDDEFAGKKKTFNIRAKEIDIKIYHLKTHPACDIVATSHIGLIQVETSRTMLRRHHEVATGTSMRQTYLRRLCDVSLVHE